jgi:hypothetical protein
VDDLLGNEQVIRDIREILRDPLFDPNPFPQTQTIDFGHMNYERDKIDFNSGAVGALGSMKADFGVPLVRHDKESRSRATHTELNKMYTRSRWDGFELPSDPAQFAALIEFQKEKFNFQKTLSH